ncbi:MAG: nicotinamide riboside transporter PnuC [Prevotellaceae bacterium]|jgi:nicotinamide mononucleotide transporter|nr:nicotinamide riboside transporter PnuC [Prevotellaceae bacterium]
MSKIEIIASAISLLCILCAVREKIATFPLGMCSTALYGYIFFSQRLYSSMSLQAVFFVFNAYGIYKWTHPAEKNAAPDNTLAVTTLDAKARLLALATVALLTLLLGYLTSSLHRLLPALFPDEAFAEIPPDYRLLCIYIDAFLLSASILAQYLMALKKIENWVIWFIVDIISAPLYAATVGAATGILYLVFIVTAIAGFAAWNRSIVVSG